MRPLVAMDRLEHRVSLRVPRPPELVDRARIDLQPVRFVHEMDDRELRGRSEANVTRVDSHRRACTGSEMCGVGGERTARREVRNEKCLDSYRGEGGCISR